jgi:predicted DNA-binding transcriptional regulator AlpA
MSCPSLVTTTLHLVGLSEIAGLLGVSRQRVHQLAAHPGFPEPVARLRAGPVWDVQSVNAWIRDRRT